LSDHIFDITDAGDTVTVWLRPEITAPAAARRAADEVTGSAAFEIRSAVELVVSELVTNSVRHAGLEPHDRIGLVATRSPGGIRIEVWDAGPGFVPPAPEPTSLKRESGWGLYLVDRLADRWGVERGAGTRVWSEFDL
jgi:anti-sigma regulatory factor (Ser/Thr protein kinase)